MSTAIKLIGWAGMAVSMFSAIGALWVFDSLNEPIAAPEAGLVVDIEPGSSIDTVTRKLERLGLIAQPRVLSWYARIYGYANRIQAGEYELTAQQTAAQVLRQLVAGKVVQRTHTLVEGWNFRQVMASLKNNSNLVQTLDGVDEAEILAGIGATETHPEGLFFPDTYRFPRDTTDVELLRQAHKLLLTRLTEAWSRRDPRSVLAKPYDGLILASIVERETALAAERATIAGVFVRRLERGMRLQTDPTVIYGLGESFDGNLTRRHLKGDTPYNTYVHKGLPPTPIALPGESALLAIAHPEPGDALYFVATGRGDGSHTFTATLEEHNAAVASYLAVLRQQRRSTSQ